MLSGRWERGVAVGSIAVAIAIAVYTGFRIPNTWTATLDAISLFDGFDRRFVVGTLLRPVSSLAHDNYWVFAGFSLAVLVALLAILAREAYRGDLARRLLIVAWLVVCGGFLVHEVGYFEQVLYVMLFAAIWLVHRGRIGAAVAIMTIAPAVHEIALLTVLPLFGLVLVRNLPFKRAAIATAIPTLVNLAILAVPPARGLAVQRLGAALAASNFEPRWDALQLFQRSQETSWSMYSFHETVVYVRPGMYVLVVAFAIAWWSDRHAWLATRDRLPGGAVLAISCAAIALPSFLIYGGWDGNRWLFLEIGNFCVVTWLALAYRPEPLRAHVALVLAIAMLVVSRVDIFYFDHRAPRVLSYRGVRSFVRQAVDGRLYVRD